MGEQTQTVENRREVKRLFRRYGPLVYRRAFKILGNAAQAEEAAQDIFIRVINGIEKFDNRSQLSTWLFKITTNHCLNVIRDGQRRRELWKEQVIPREEARPAPPSTSDILLTQQLLAEADPQEATAAVCVFMEGMTGDEAARTMGVSRRTVTNLVNRFRDWAIARMEKPPP